MTLAAAQLPVDVCSHIPHTSSHCLCSTSCTCYRSILSWFQQLRRHHHRLQYRLHMFSTALMCSHACIIYIVWGWRTKLTYDLIFYNQYMHTFLLVSASMIFVLEVCLWILPSPSVISASTVKCTHTCMACHQFIFPMLAPLLFHNQTSKILVI